MLLIGELMKPQKCCMLRFHETLQRSYVRFLILVTMQMLFTSLRYSIVAQTNLIKSVACKTLLAPEPRPPVTNAILESCELQVLKVPTIEDLFDSDFAHYPYEKSFENARHELLMILHTSDTTGLPKPII